MSFNFSNNINQFKAQSAYKDASGMGGGGMYFKQKKKKDEPEEDLFESQDKNDTESIFDDEVDIKEKDIPRENKFNQFMNWFRPNN